MKPISLKAYTAAVEMLYAIRERMKLFASEATRRFYKRALEVLATRCIYA